MGLEFFRRSVELADRYLRPGQRAVYTIQTNATLLDEEWADFFREHDFLVGGPSTGRASSTTRTASTRAERAASTGRARARRAAIGWSRLERPDHDPRGERRTRPRGLLLPARRARGAASSSSSRSSSASRSGEEAGSWTSWRDRPLYVQEGDAVTDRSVTAEQYGRFLIDVFEEWVRRDVGEVYVQMFDVALANWVGEPPSLCVHSETCGLGARARAHRRRLLLRPLRRAEAQAREHPDDPPARPGRLAAAAAVRARQAGDAPAVLPRLRRALRLPRRLPEGPLHRDACRRAGPELPLRRLQGVLPPRRRADADDGGAAGRGPRARGDRRPVRGGRRPARP